MLAFFRILIVFLTLVSADLQTTVIIESEPKNNKYFMKICLFGLSIMRVIVSIKAFDVLKRRLTLKINGKLKRLTLSANMADTESIAYLMTSPTIKAIDVKYIKMSFEVGGKSNPFYSVMILQTVKLLFYSFCGFIRSRQNLVNEGRFSMNNDNNELSLRFHCILSLTIINVIWSLVLAFKRRLKINRKKEEVVLDNK